MKQEWVVRALVALREHSIDDTVGKLIKNIRRGKHMKRLIAVDEAEEAYVWCSVLYGHLAKDKREREKKQIISISVMKHNK